MEGSWLPPNVTYSMNCGRGGVCVRICAFVCAGAGARA